MATGLTLISAGQGYLSSSRAYKGQSSNSKFEYFETNELDEMATGEQGAVNSGRSPWIRLFKLFQSKNRDEAQRRASTGSSKIKQKEEFGLTVDTMSKARKNSREEDVKPKRNIYRRPSSRTIVNPRGSHCGPLYEGYSPQRYNRRSSDPVDDSIGGFTEPGSDEILYSRVRRQRSRSVPAICQGAGLRRKSEQARRDAQNKQTNFREDVSVVYYEEDHKSAKEKHSGLRVNMKNVKINDRFEEDESSTSSLEHDSIDSEKPSCSSEISSEQSPTIIISPGGTQSIDVPPSFNVGKNRQGIRLMIELDRQCLRKKTSVKAMSGGRTFEVLTYKNVEESDTEVMEFTDRINLPVAIDPFSVRANVLRSGHLCIEAPLRKASF